MIKVLEIPLYEFGLKKVIEEIIQCVERNEVFNRCISATGAHGLITAKKDRKFYEILKSFYINLPDGMPSVWVGRLKGAREIKRCYGPDFFRETIMATKNKNVKHFLCGGKEGVADELKKVCEIKYDNHSIVGTYSPPFREMTDQELKKLANNINNLKVDIVWIGLSTPKQEIFAYRLSKYTNVKFLCTIGAAFDFHTDRVKQAPKWIQKIGMEWFFRLLIEPKRLWKRYFTIVPLFIWYNILEMINKKVLKLNLKNIKHI